MLDRVLGLAPHLRRKRHAASNATFLVGEREHYAVDAEAEQVLDLLDGVRTIEQVLGACVGLASPLVLELLVRLEQQGVIGPVDDTESARAAFETGAAVARAPQPAVVVIDRTTTDGDEARVVRSALEGVGLLVVSEPGPDTVSVIVATDYLAPGCVEVALAERRAGRRCFLVKPAGLRPFIGPLLSPDPGQPCARCLSHALERQRPVERLLLGGGDEDRWSSLPHAALPASVTASANLAAVELRKLLGAREGVEPRGCLWSLDLVDFELADHEVRRRPQCPECGDERLMARRGEQAIVLSSVPIAYRADGGFRRESPTRSYASLRHLVSPVLGPIAHLGPMPGRHTETRPVFSSTYFLTPRHGVEHRGFTRACAGKGRTLEQARMGALAEAIERLSSVYQGDEAVVRASVAALGSEAIHPDELQLFGRAQRASGGRNSGRHSAPPPLDGRTEIMWTPAWSLTHECRRYLPLAYCYSDVPAECMAYCRPSSNGTAAGTCLEEAILQGLLELVERDAVAMWWYGRIRRPAARISSTLAPYFDELRAEYAALGWRIWTLDLTHDLGLPVVTAVAAHERSERFALGFGCHPEADLAVSRALTELNQVFDPERMASSPWDGMEASKLACLHPDASASPVRPAPGLTSLDLRDHIMTWVGRLSERGLETIVIDKTRPDLELSVAQVVVPGLRHVWPRLGPGRLYTVPVELGWLAEPLREDQLNPLPLLV